MTHTTRVARANPPISMGNADGGEFDEASYDLVACEFEATTSLSEIPAEHVLLGEARSGFGAAVAAAGNVDLDGYSDFLVGAPSAGAGSAYLYTGNAAADISGAYLRLYSEYTSSQAGLSLSAGDLDGDGIRDLVIGAPSYMGGRGIAFMESGAAIAPGVKGLAGAKSRFVGEVAGDYAGFAVEASGDFNGDGVHELVVSAYAYDKFGKLNIGAIYIFNGPVSAGTLNAANATAKLTGEAAGDLAGSSVAAAGDINGDGIGDVLVGAHSQDSNGIRDAGAVYLLYGPVVGAHSLASAVKLTGGAAGDRAGTSIARAGDVDADGYDDFAVGAPGARGAPGKVYLVYGSSAGPSSGPLAAWPSFVGAAGGDQLGQSVAGTGDLNNDGAADLIFGAPGAIGRSGAVYVFYGDFERKSGTSSVSTLPAFTGRSANDRAGSALAVVGDVNADGRYDFIIGAPGFNSGAGAVYLILGRGPDRYFADDDDDGFGAPGLTWGFCGGPPAGFVRDSSDCNDANAAVNPVAQEICNEIDDDCDRLVDDADASVIGGLTLYHDGDGDGFGAQGEAVEKCVISGGSWIEDGTDANDRDPAVH